MYREEITVKVIMQNKKTRLSTISGSSADHFALTTLPAVLKSLFDGTNVATTPRYLRATFARWALGKLLGDTFSANPDSLLSVSLNELVLAELAHFFFLVGGE